MNTIIAMNNRFKTSVLYFVSFLGQGTIYMINLAIVYYLRYSKGLDPSLVGLAFGAYTLSYFCGCMFLSSIYVRIRSDRLIMLSLSAMALAILAIIFSSSTLVVFLLLVLYGLFMSLLWPPLEEWLLDECTVQSTGRIVNGFNFSWCLGVGFAPYIASLIIARNPLYVFYFSIAVFVLLDIAILVLSRLSPPKQCKPVENDNFINRDSVLGKGRIRNLRLFSWIAVFIGYAMQAIFFNIFPMYASEQLGMSSSTSGFLLMLRGAVAAFAFLFLGATCFWELRIGMVFLTELSFLVLAILVSFISSATAIGIVFIVFGFFFALCVSLSSFHSACGMERKIATMRIHEAVINLGSVIGASIGGIVYQKVGYSSLWHFVAISLIVVVLSQLVYMIEGKRTTC